MELGIFQETVTLVNRAPVALNVRFNGQDKTLKPGDNVGIPTLVVSYAKAQNPRMGTEDPHDPMHFEPLVGVKGTRDNCTPLTDEEWAAHLGKPQRIDRTEYDQEIKEKSPRAKIEVRGRKKHSMFRVRAQQPEDGEVFSQER